jgi:hypothetical protein
MFSLPALKTRQRGRFIRRIRDRNQGHLHARLLYCYLLRGRFRAGRHHASSLAFHLAEVRRPGCVGDTGRFIFIR